MTIHKERVLVLNRQPVIKGQYVLYWMQQSQRVWWNHALEFAIEKANELSLPLVVIFGLTLNYPEANSRHFNFMFQGLKETSEELANRGIQMLIYEGEPDKVALAGAKKASMVICDCGYLRHQRAWHQKLARNAPCSVIQVETDTIVPIKTASNKADYAARTLRPKIQRVLERFLCHLSPRDLKQSSLDLNIRNSETGKKVNLQNMKKILKSIDKEDPIGNVDAWFTGGYSNAKQRFEDFLENNLQNYDKNSNQPQTDDCSYLSPYLHFGQISPLYLAMRIMHLEPDAPQPVAAWLEQLIIRRELAFNYVWNTPDYDKYTALPNWAVKTLKEHSIDPRPVIYPVGAMEAADTHDPYWNAAMKEMKYTGFMHNYMRMYWGKKVLEWSPDPESAFNNLLYLNNRYFLDGRDPNSYAGVGWIFGLHDRAWKERDIFGKVRCMTSSGLERKCDIKAYVKKVEDRVMGLKMPD